MAANQVGAAVAAAVNPPQLTARWTELRPFDLQTKFLNSTARFIVVPAGRRSGKTEIAKRKIVIKGLRAAHQFGPNYFFGAPTRDQAKRIFWKDLKAMIPARFMARKPSETELSIELINGVTFWVVGMDKPERIEGTPWDGGVLDEYANMKPHAWGENVRPALEDRGGFCIFTGVPEGRNHYYDMFKAAQIREGWEAYTWKSAEILPPHVIESAKQDLDELSFQQEYEASFVNFQGRAYYPFDEKDHCGRLFDRYNPKNDLILCMDFNVDPGTAVIAQEMDLPLRQSGLAPIEIGGAQLLGNMLAAPTQGTGVIGEVHIPNNSNTPAVVRKFIADWGKHQGRILVYGDATGGNRGTAKVHGSDWDLVKQGLYAHFGDDRVFMDIPRANPTERARLNAVNTRLKSGTGSVHLMVDPEHAPNVVRDFEGVRLLEGGSGEIDKKHDKKLTHLTDGLGYYVVKKFPVRKVQSVAGTIDL